MTSARTGGLLSGAAQGAATGSIIPGVGPVVGAIIGGIGGFISGSSADAQFSNQLAWAAYNRQKALDTANFNIMSNLAIAGFNASLARRAAAAESANIMAAAKYNANIIRMTTEYNNDLLENELTRTWNDLGLDIQQIEMFRAKERGTLVAQQAVSGTVVGQDSNAVVVRDQMTQEAMDIAVVTHGAEREAANIANQQAQGRWQGDVAIQQTMWEGEMQAWSTQYNASVQSAGMIGSAILQAGADMYNAKQAYQNAGYSMEQAKWNQGEQQTQNMVSGLFSAASTYVSSQYAAKVPGSGTSTTGAGTNYGIPSTSLVTRNNQSLALGANISNPYYDASRPGSTLMLTN